MHSDLTSDFLPNAPKGSKSLPDVKTMIGMKKLMTESPIDRGIEIQIRSLIDRWLTMPREVNPIEDMQKILEPIRKLSPGEERALLMNSFVKTLGQPKLLATYLDMLRDSAQRTNSNEQNICETKLQKVKMHSVYGWCGNTLSIESFTEPTPGTFPSEPGLEERLGNPAAAWNVTIHIWQPNATAEGFPVFKKNVSDVILEPPHTHPFDFVSLVVTGRLHQSIYKQLGPNERDMAGIGHYRNMDLEHVDGVWPPHTFRNTCQIATLEHRVPINSGDSYYMPCDWIHDVEVVWETAKTQPAITLFLSSEYLVMPHVYMTKQMADYHLTNPEIKKDGKELTSEAWHQKLKAIASYLRGENEYLNLNEIVKHTGSYAFFNI